MMKNKNIVERFIKSNGKEKNNSIETLKPISAGSFKVQRSMKVSNQRDKTKALMIMEDLTKPLNSQNPKQGDVEDYILSNRPPNPENLNMWMNIKEANMQHEGSSNGDRATSSNRGQFGGLDGASC